MSFHDSGMSMVRACGRVRPVINKNSSTLSSEAESLLPGSTTGKSFCKSSPNKSLLSKPSRACIHKRLPFMVLISPLWAIILKGWAKSQVGKVLVLKRECTKAMALCKPGSFKSR